MIIKDIFTDRVFTGKLLSLTVPITLQNLMLAMVAAADAVMLGRVEQNAMAAVSLATQIQFVQNVLMSAITCGIGILGAQYWGKRDLGVIGKIFGSSIRESLAISLVFFIGCRFFPEELMHIFAEDDELIRIGAEYLSIASWSYLITGISQCYLAVMKVTGQASRSAWISSGAVIVNIVLNAVFIFGFAAIPALGVRGAALATLLARVIELLWCVISTAEKEFIRLKISTIFEFDRMLIADFWRYSLPVLGSYTLWGIGFTAYTALMGHLGPDAAAANAVAAVVRDLMCCLCNGIAGGAAILIGNELGAGKLRIGRIYGERTMVLSYIIGIFSALVILLALPFALNYMKLTELAAEYMTGMFFILAFYMIGRCVSTVIINGIFPAGGDTLFDFYSLIVCMWLLALPCAIAGTFYFHWPVLLVYGCTCLDEVGKIPWVMVHYRKYKWVRDITR